jgi:hypothetical protein
MSFRGFPSALLILSALALSAAAQSPTPATTAFDGKYVGTAAITGGRMAFGCFPIPHADMTITGGQVVIHETQSDGATVTFGGSLNAAGEVSGSFCQKGFMCASLSGTVHDKIFEGSQTHGYWCYFNVRMAAAPAPTMPFDGWYRGVSREMLDGGSNRHTCDPRALSAPATLKIENGVIGIPRGPSWQGTATARCRGDAQSGIQPGRRTNRPAGHLPSGV